MGKTYKKKKTATVGTQTDLDLNPKVILSRISISHEEYPEVHKTYNNTKTSIPVQKPVAKAPTSYQNFAKRISNNEKASSTLVSKEFERNVEHRLPTPPPRRRSSLSKKVRFKPGPQCYKRRLLRSGAVTNEDNDDMNIPIMLSEPSSPNETDGNLNTIIEQVDENCEVPEIELSERSIDIDEIENIEITTLRSLDVAYQNLEYDNVIDNNEAEITNPQNRPPSIQNKAAMTAQAEDIPQQNTVKLASPSRSEIRASRNADNVLSQEVQTTQTVYHTENIQIRFEGATNIISHQNYHGERKDSSSKEENDDAPKSDSFETNSHFIKIYASNVHIHNHLYKC